MTAPPETRLPVPTPHFIDGPKGRLFCLSLEPAERPAPAVALYLPAFGEEMNRSRRMASLLGRALAARGCAALLLDPGGTGDSAGDFAAASWTAWRQDAVAALDWLAQRGHRRLHLIGLRAGANLALEAAAERSEVGSLVLWQPLLDGKLFLNQLLRIRVAAGLGGTSTGGGEAKETTGGLRQRLRDGETLEVAGYALSPALADEIESLDLVAAAARDLPPLHWIELAANPEADPPPASARALQALADAGRDIDYRRLAGEPFWSIEEPVLIEALIEASVETLCGAAP